MLVKLDLIYTSNRNLSTTYYFFQPEYKVLVPIRPTKSYKHTFSKRPFAPANTKTPLLLQLEENASVLVYKDGQNAIRKTHCNLGTGLKLARFFDVPVFGSWGFIMENGINVTKKLIEGILPR